MLKEADRQSDGTALRERTGVQSLERAFAILEAIASRPEGISLAEFSKQVGLHSSTAYHLVRTMVSLGYVRQDAASKRYHIGRKVFALAASSRRDIDFVAIAGPILDSLSTKTGESTHLAIFSGNEVMVVARSMGSGAFQLRESHGGVRPGHATALGKILLAALDPPQLERYLQAHKLEALTARSIIEPERLMAELQKVRNAAIAFDDCEFDVDVRCVAVPVRDFTGEVVAALGLSGPVWRLSLQAITELSDEVKKAAQAISGEIGG